ncbi:hypothetical protein, partial [Thiolapillus sp.]|uniref:hypothetical protein n=1 Tax=Thiolapillus sp. TaxID=2017437 RepID=UPI003AF6BFA9
GGTFADGFEAGVLSGIQSGIYSGIGEAKSLGGPSIGNLGAGITVKRVLAHGLVGGAFARARGDSFGSGFATGVFSKLSAGTLSKNFSDPFTGAAASAIIGGTASTLSGGKFANGALSGAFGYLFNQLGNGRGKIVGRDTKGRTFSEAMTIGRKAAKVGRVVNIFGDDLYDRGDQTLIKIFNRWKVTTHP